MIKDIRLKALKELKKGDKKMKKYYVTMTDKFLSGWGRAKDKINKVVIECDSLQEAETVAENARNRSDMIRVNIATKKPYYNKDKYLISFRTKSDWPAWFEKDYFKY